LAVQFILVASAFKFLTDAVVIDDNSEDPENLMTYRQRIDFLRHAARVFPRLYDSDQIRHRELLDGFWTELQRELARHV
jgi:hypothetical protein